MPLPLGEQARHTRPFRHDDKFYMTESWEASWSEIPHASHTEWKPYRQGPTNSVAMVFSVHGAYLPRGTSIGGLKFEFLSYISSTALTRMWFTLHWYRYAVFPYFSLFHFFVLSTVLWSREAELSTSIEIYKPVLCPRSAWTFGARVSRLLIGLLVFFPTLV